MRVVERGAHRLDDLDRLEHRHALRIPFAQKMTGVGAVDEVHGDPQPPVERAAVVDPDDVRMPQLSDQVGFAVEPFLKVGVGRDVGAQHLERILARQSGVLGEVDLAHAPHAEQSLDRVASNLRTVAQRHARSVPTSAVPMPSTWSHWPPRGRTMRNRAPAGAAGAKLLSTAAATPMTGATHDDTHRSDSRRGSPPARGRRRAGPRPSPPRRRRPSRPHRRRQRHRRRARQAPRRRPPRTPAPAATSAEPSAPTTSAPCTPRSPATRST